MVPGKMFRRFWLPTLFLCLATLPASAQPGYQGGGSFHVQCPTATLLHPGGTGTGNSTPATSEAQYNGPVSRSDVFNNPYCAGPTYVNGQPNPNYGTGECNSGTSPDGAVGVMAAPSIGVDAAAIMNTGVLNGNIPAPLMAFDEDDEFFLTLTNVGMIMRPDLFEQHTVHFHGYPNASSFYDGVPDASLAINIGGSFTYYYVAPDADTYFWHCHITPPEHLQMGRVGQLFVRPRQNRPQDKANLLQSLAGCLGNSTDGPARGLPSVLGQQSDIRTA